MDSGPQMPIRWRSSASSSWFTPDTEVFLLAWVKENKLAWFCGCRDSHLESMICLVGKDVVPDQPVSFN